MGGWWAKFTGDPGQPVSGQGERVVNVLKNNWRGIFGVVLPLVVLSWQGEKMRHDITTQCMWLWMFWFYLVQPVTVEATSLIPIFLLPMAGVLATVETCKCYFNEAIALFILGGMLQLLLNNSGYDRRMILWFLGSGDACQFSGGRLMFKCSMAAFFGSVVCNKLIVTDLLVGYVAPPLMQLQSSTAKYRRTEPDYDRLRCVIMNAIQTSASLGSISIVHASFSVLAFRAIWNEAPPKGNEYPDIFNYMQYFAYAFPLAFVTLLVNSGYHMFLLHFVVVKQMSLSSMTAMQKSILAHKKSVPKDLTSHEMITLVALAVTMILFFFRWCTWLGMGWANFSKAENNPDLPKVRDATVAAIMVFLLHFLPKSFGFIQVLKASNQNDIPAPKPDSAIMFWRFVDKNTNYACFLLIGAGIAIYRAAVDSGLCATIGQHSGAQVTAHSRTTGLFLICLIAVVLANLMSGVAALVVFLPYALCMALHAAAPKAAAAEGGGEGGDRLLLREDADAAGGGGGGGEAATESPAEAAAKVWLQSAYLVALGVGVGCSYGFALPFINTPAYFVHHKGKVPVLKMVKYSIVSSVICIVVLWVSLVYWAPYIFDPTGAGVAHGQKPVVGAAATTAAADDATEPTSLY